MNRISVLVLVLTVVFGTSLSCKKGPGTAGKTNASLKTQIDQSGFKLPDGTVFIENLDESGTTTSVEFQLPSDCKLFGVTATGEVMYDNGGKLTCTCSGNGSCKPFATGGKMGCLVDGCTKCTGTTAPKMSATPLEFYLIQKGQLGGMDVLATLGNTRPIYSFEEWQAAWFPTQEEMSSQVFIDALNALITYVEPFGNKNLVAVAYMVNGKKMLINVPFSSLDDGTMYAPAVADGNYACSGSCNSGQTKCKLESASMGQIYYCDGCQSGCSISMTK